MTIFPILFLLIVSATASKVTVLTQDNFDKETEKGVWMVKFYAPWCGHCKKLIPTYDELAASDKLNGAKVGKVDCTVHQDVCSRFGIRGYPTLKVIKEKNYYDYNNPRNLDSLLEFLTKGYQEAEAKEILSAAEQRKLEKQEAELFKNSKVHNINNANFKEKVGQSKDKWFLKFYAPWCGHCKRLAPTWHKLSNELIDTDTKVGKIDCTVDRRLCSRFGVSGYPSLFFVKDGHYWKYQGARTLPVFKEFSEKGYEGQSPLGPIPEETILSTIFDGILEWAGQNTTFAAILGILLLAVFVALLVACLDHCMGDEEVPPPGKSATKLVDGQNKTD